MKKKKHLEQRRHGPRGRDRGAVQHLLLQACAAQPRCVTYLLAVARAGHGARATADLGCTPSRLVRAAMALLPVGGTGGGRPLRIHLPAGWPV